MRRPSLADLQTLIAIAEHRSFRRAAVTLGVSPSALSHTVRSLEDRTGVRLLNRTTRSVALTDAGVRLVGRLRPALAGIDEALAELAEEGAAQVAGRVRIASMAYGARLLVEGAVSSFIAAHPSVEMEISVDSALVDLVADGFDAGVRFRDQIPADMAAVPIGPPAAMVAFASPAYLAERPPPVTPADLAAHLCTRQRLASGGIHRWEFEGRGRAISIEPRGPFTTDDLAVIVLAALRGQGVGYAGSHHVRELFNRGDLVQLLPEFSPHFDGHCLYYPSARRHTRAFAAFLDHVKMASKVWASMSDSGTVSLKSLI